ncbi:MAG TPA: NAD(P)H-binding protein [Propionibacteriaceae bacterium]
MHLLTVVAPRRREGSSPTGIVGRSLARQLIAAGDRVRVLAEPEMCHDWPSSVEVVRGSVASPAGSAPAWLGVETLFLAGADPETVPEVLAFAVASQLQRIVLLSSHGPEYEEAYPPDTWYWLAIERAVQQSGIPTTVVRPSAVMGSMIEGTYPATGSDWPESIRTEGVVREPFAREGHYPFIHEEDLAAVAAAALRSDAYVGQVLEAVGPPLSTRSRVDSIAAAIGRTIDLLEVTPELARTSWRERGWPDGAIEVTLYALEEYGARRAELARWTLDQRPTVSDIIGRRPRSYNDWAKEHCHLFR